MEGAESTRLSIRMRGGSLGHHQALEKEERFGRFQSEMFARLVWGLGAMAAERVFYGENSSASAATSMSATAQAAYDGRRGRDGPEPFARDAARRRDGGRRAAARPQALRADRPADHEPHGRRRAVRGRIRSPACSRDPTKRALVGADPRPGVRRRAQPRSSPTATRSSRSPTCWCEKREIFGDELLELLDGARIGIPSVDLSDEASWPPANFSAQVGGSPRPALPESNGARP